MVSHQLRADVLAQGRVRRVILLALLVAMMKTWPRTMYRGFFILLDVYIFQAMSDATAPVPMSDSTPAEKQSDPVPVAAAAE